MRHWTVMVSDLPLARWIVTFTSPSGVASTYAINVQQTTALNPKPSDCP